MERIPLSIITIVLNDPNGLEQTFRSLLPAHGNESLEIEHIIVDSTPEAHSALKEKYSYAKWTVMEPRGIYSALNLGNSLAQSEFVWHLHAGDRLSSLENLLDALQHLHRSPQSSLLFAPILLSEISKESTISQYRPNFRRSVLLGKLNHPGVIFRRRIFAEIGNFSEDYKIAGDLEFFVRTANRNLTVESFPRPFCDFNLSGASNRNRLLTMMETQRALSQMRRGPLEKIESEARLRWGLFLAKLVERNEH